MTTPNKLKGKNSVATFTKDKGGIDGANAYKRQRRNGAEDGLQKTSLERTATTPTKDEEKKNGDDAYKVKGRKTAATFTEEIKRKEKGTAPDDAYKETKRERTAPTHTKSKGKKTGGNVFRRERGRRQRLQKSKKGQRQPRLQ